MNKICMREGCTLGITSKENEITSYPCNKYSNLIKCYYQRNFNSFSRFIFLSRFRRREQLPNSLKQELLFSFILLRLNLVCMDGRFPWERKLTEQRGRFSGLL